MQKVVSPETSIVPLIAPKHYRRSLGISRKVFEIFAKSGAMESPSENLQYDVKWPQRDEVVRTSCYEFFKQSSYTDVTICSEGFFVPCHQIILASCSPYFDVSCRLFCNTFKQYNKTFFRICLRRKATAIATRIGR